MLQTLFHILIPVAYAHSISPEQLKKFNELNQSEAFNQNLVYGIAGFFGLMVVITLVLMIRLKKKTPQAFQPTTSGNRSMPTSLAPEGEELLDISSK